MSVTFDAALLDALSDMVTERSGLRFNPDRRADLERGVRAAAHELGFADPRECATALVSSPLTSAQVRILASHLTIGETYFFREKASFQLIEDRILPELIEARRGHGRRIRLWSAGCCTGEEPYSLAICLARLLPEPHDWDITILGTDINEHFLQKARAATYGEWSFRETSAEILAGCFTRKSAGRYHLLPHLRRGVTFSPLNLAEDDYTIQFAGADAADVILCRNVLIYFDQAQGARLVRNLSKCLVEGGWLLLGASEGSQVQCEDLVPAARPGTVAFRKCTGGHRSAEMRVPVSFQAETIAPVSPMPIALEVAAGSIALAPPTPSREKVTGDAAESTLLQAVASYEKGDYGDVVLRLLPLCSAGRGTARSLELLTRAYANQGEGSLALDWCEKTLLLDKMNSRLHYLRGAILQERGDMGEAAASYRRAIYLDSEFVMAHIGAGHVAASLGRRKAAIQFLSSARRLLGRFAPNESVPEAEGLDAQHLAELIASDLDKGRLA